MNTKKTALPQRKPSPSQIVFGPSFLKFDRAGTESFSAPIARGHLKLAQAEATALVMAYGHGTLAGLGPDSELMRSIPAAEASAAEEGVRTTPKLSPKIV